MRRSQNDKRNASFSEKEEGFITTEREGYSSSLNRAISSVSGSIISVRVGGGYKNITDFIEVYSELEQGRLERRGSTS